MDTRRGLFAQSRGRVGDSRPEGYHCYCGKYLILLSQSIAIYIQIPPFQHAREKIFTAFSPKATKKLARSNMWVDIRASYTLICSDSDKPWPQFDLHRRRTFPLETRGDKFRHTANHPSHNRNGTPICFRQHTLDPPKPCIQAPLLGI